MASRLLISSLLLGAAPWLTAGVVAAHEAKAAASAAAKHWAFQPVTNPAPPVVKDSAWPRNDIDRFILARLESHGVHPAMPADKATLIRRATFDLTGLPPAPADVEAFERDSSSEAFAKVVDRLLASPQYGEKWGGHWLDLVRYADTAGENSDHPIPEAWRYRNWVIRAFNRNEPYDEFIREQIAGDILAKQGPPEKAADRIIATGYLAISRRFGHKIEEDMNLTLADTLDTLGKSVLGLTIGCARCHDHKYDPISTQDYYALYGIFQSTKFAYPGCEPEQRPHDMVPLMPQGEMDQLMRSYDDELARLNAQLKERETELAKEKHELADFAEGLPQEPSSALVAAVNDLRKRRDECIAGKPVIPVAYAVAEGTSGDAKIQKRGEIKSLGDEVPRRFLEILGGQALPQSEKGSGRLELAQWLTDPANPLTARVMVNRIWQNHFGVGLVSTPNDFGTRGAPPSDPELLDYLATAFVKSGWDIKAMHRLIMLSAAYQQASADGDGHEGFATRRLSAEEIRDALLVVSGDLDSVPGEAHPFPPVEQWGYTQHTPFNANYETNKRSVYVMRKRNTRDRFFSLFDGPDPNESTAVRQVSTVPTQALFFLNDPFVYARAQSLGRRLMSIPDDRSRLDLACKLLFSRPATDADFADFQQFASDYQVELKTTPKEKQAAEIWAAYAHVLFGANEFLYVD